MKWEMLGGHMEPEDNYDDEALAARVREAIMLDSHGDAHNVEIQAEHGEVYLWGEVTDPQTKAIIEDLAAHLLGVLKVHSNIVSLR